MPKVHELKLGTPSGVNVWPSNVDATSIVLSSSTGGERTRLPALETKGMGRDNGPYLRKEQQIRVAARACPHGSNLVVDTAATQSLVDRGIPHRHLDVFLFSINA